ncbi:MAG: DUF2142 domain-containing protein [Candidatus Kapaibacterium sp.]
MKTTNKLGLQSLNLEHFFVIIGLIFGIWIVLLNPPFHSADEERHFYDAYALADGQFIFSNIEGKKGKFLPKRLVESASSLWQFPFHAGHKMNDQMLEEELNKPLNPDEKVLYRKYNYKRNPIPYLPHAIGILAGKLIRENTVFILWAGRIAGLIFYLALMYYAIRLMPIAKSLLFLYGLTPIVLFQGASVNYDMMNNALGFLMLAMALDYTYREGQLDLKKIAAFVIIALVHAFTKNGYFLIPFVFLIIPRNKLGPVWKMLVIAALLAFVYFAADLIWDSAVKKQLKNPEKNEQISDKKEARESLKAGSKDDNRKGKTNEFWLQQRDFYFNPKMNIERAKEDPFKYGELLFRNIMYFKNEWTHGIVGRFGHSYLQFPDFIVIFHILILISAAFLDSNPEKPLNIRQKAIIGGIGVLTGLMIIGGVFLMASPVGAHMIFGFQGRYLIPVVPMILILAYSSGFRLEWWHKWRGLIVPVYASIFLLYTVIYMQNYFYE